MSFSKHEFVFKVLFGTNGQSVFRQIMHVHDRFPTLLPLVTVESLCIFLSNATPAFLSIRAPALIRRIFFTILHLTKQIEKSLDKSECIHLKVISVSPSVCGIIVFFSNLDASEILNEQTLFKGVQNLIIGTKPVIGSYLNYRRGLLSIHYIEVRKIRGGIFSYDEWQKLRSFLSTELSKTMHSTSQYLIFPGNEEELFKNIRHLNQEIKSINDIPQVMVSFVECSSERLKFLVIVLRVKNNEKSSTITEMKKHLPAIVVFSLETNFCTGILSSEYSKEALIFTLDVSSAFFSRDPHIINLRSARLFIVKILENMLGPFRDYNGGLLYKESEQLFSIRRALEAEHLSISYLDDLFYNTKPISRRFLMTVETGFEIIKALQNIIPIPLKGSHLIQRQQVKDLQLAVVKTTHKNWKENIPAKMLSFSANICHSHIEKEGFLYLCFFQQFTNDEAMFEQLHKELSQESQLTDTRQNLLRLNFQGGDPPSLNPRLAFDIHSHTLISLLFEGLTRLESGKVIPAIAQSIIVSPCGTIYTFHLRQTLWSNGSEVTAYHFEKAWKKALMSASLAPPYSNFFFSILNAKKARSHLVPLNEVGIVALNDTVLEVKLERPHTCFLKLVATPPFFPLPNDMEEPTDFNGPFMLARWKRNELIHLSQNPFYSFARTNKIEQIQISTIPDPYIAYEKFQKGELDFIGDPISPLPLDLINCPKIQKSIIHLPISRVFWIHCNLQTFPFYNKALRKALHLSLDRHRLIEKVLRNHLPLFSPLPLKYSRIQGALEGDPKQAMLFLNQALRELNIDRHSLPLITFTHSNLSFEKPLVTELTRQWQETLGIKVISHELPWYEFSAALEKGDFQLGGIYRRDLFSNPLFYFSFFKRSPQNPYSLGRLYSQHYKLFAQNGDDGANFQNLENLLMEEMPVIPLAQQSYSALASPKMQGFAWDENGCLNLRAITCETV